MTANRASLSSWVHLTAYIDAQASMRILEQLKGQSNKPDLIRIIDNSPLPLKIAYPGLPVHIEHHPNNLGTAGAINRSIHSAQQHNIDYLWILDQDSEPNPQLLEKLLNAHQQLSNQYRDPVGIVAPLTRNRADAKINVPMRWNRFKPEKIFIGNHIIQAELLPAAGMLIHIPSIKKINLPSNRYFLDCYDFALGLAVKEVGASVCVVPSLELSHQVSQKVPITTAKDQRLVTDMPAHRVKLQHRNTTYLATRNSKGIYRLAAAIHQGIKATKHARRIRTNKMLNWRGKSHAALHGWILGLFSLTNAHSRK